MARYITKLVKDPSNIIFTNIKMNYNAPNLYNYQEKIEDKLALQQVIELTTSLQNLEFQLNELKKELHVTDTKLKPQLRIQKEDLVFKI